MIRLTEDKLEDIVVDIPLSILREELENLAIVHGSLLLIDLWESQFMFVAAEIR